MKRFNLTFLSFFILLSCRSFSQDLPAKSTWQGNLSGIRVLLKLSTDSATKLKTAVFDSPNQGATGISVSELKITADSLIASSDVMKGVFKGAFNSTYTSLRGTWSQRGVSVPLELSILSTKRPQTPVAPFPYTAKTGTYYNKDKSIRYGYTLTLPGVDKDYPAVILISGSGQQDRDETIFDHKPFLVIADYLTRNGIAVLRVDDRGIGQTTGDVTNATSSDFAKDVMVGIDYLKTQTGIDSKRIGLIGHSEGGLIAPIVASESKDVAFIVSMAGLGIKGSELMIRQVTDSYKKVGIDEDGLKRIADLRSQMFLLSEQHSDINNFKSAFKLFMTDWISKQPETFLLKTGYKGPSAEKIIDMQATSIFSPWMRYLAKYDPATTLTKVTIPVLAINGSQDSQVISKDNLEGFRKYLKQAGNKNFKVMEFPGLNHLFQHASTGDVGEYAAIEETISVEVLKVITEWIKSL